MKIKLEQIDAVKNSLKVLLSKEVPIKAAFKLSKLTKQLDKELTDLEDHRRKLVHKYGTDVGDGKMQVDANKRDAFIEDYRALLSVEIDIDFTPISVDELGDIQISSVDLANLGLSGLIADGD